MMIISKPLQNVQKFVHMVFLCLNLIFQTITLLVMIFHIYAVIGMKIFNTNYNIHVPSTLYETTISDFNDYKNSLIIMLQVVTENGWSNIIYNYADKFGSFFRSAIFFDSFYLIVKFIILSLLTGLIWEIFTIISSTLKPGGEDEASPKDGQNNGDSENSDEDDEERSIVGSCLWLGF